MKDTDGVWKLAGIGIDTDGYYSADPSGTPLLDSGWPGLASLFDQSDLYIDWYTGSFVPASGPGHWYATRISARAAFIDSICPTVPEPGEIAAAFAAFGALASLAHRR